MVRNRLRRQVRELMRARAQRLPSGWYLIGVERPAVDNNWGQLGIVLDHLLDRIVSSTDDVPNPKHHAISEAL